MVAQFALVEVGRDAAVAIAAAIASELALSSFDKTSKEICQCLAVINESLLQIRDGIKVGPGASESISQGVLNRQLASIETQIAATKEAIAKADEDSKRPPGRLPGNAPADRRKSDLEEQLDRLNQTALDLQIKLKRFDEIDTDQLQSRIDEAEAQAADMARRLDRGVGEQDLAETQHGLGLLSDEDFGKAKEKFDALFDEAEAVSEALKQLKDILAEITGETAPETTKDLPAFGSGMPFFALGAQAPVTAEGVAQLFKNPAESAEAVSDALQTVDEKHEGLVEAAEERNTDLMKSLGDAVDEFSDRAASSLTNLVLTGEFSAKKLGQVFKNLVFDFARQQLNNLFGSIFNSILGAFLPGRATGGKINPGVPVLVGERGPELIVPFDAGRVINASRTRALAADGGGPVTVNQAITFTTDVRNSVRAEVLTMAPAVASAARDAVLGTLTRPRF